MRKHTVCGSVNSKLESTCLICSIMGMILNLSIGTLNLEKKEKNSGNRWIEKCMRDSNAQNVNKMAKTKDGHQFLVLQKLNLESNI